MLGLACILILILQSECIDDIKVTHIYITKNVMHYLQGTKDYKLIYKRSDLFEIIGYSNSNFIEYADSLKSTLGNIFILVDWAISWKSVK